MRDLSFYKQVDHPQVEYRGHSFNMPVFYYDVTAVMVGFLPLSIRSRRYCHPPV